MKTYQFYAAGIWTEDHSRAISRAKGIEAGTVYLTNYFNACIHSPVDGYKQSGYGGANWLGGFQRFCADQEGVVE